MEQMEQHDGGREAKRVVWGVFLIALGALFLLGQFGTFHWAGLIEWWPLIFFAIGVGQIIDRRIGAAVTSFLVGGWFFACESGWYGLDYGNSWGLVLVAVGIGIVIRALLGEPSRRGRRTRGAL
jgi:hypothetical protein